jgi:DNA-binding NtrC family response regulator
MEKQSTENSLRILMVDDDEGLLAALAEFIQLRGLRVRACRDGREALNLIHQEKEPYDIVLTDLVMPSAGGLEVLRGAKDRFARTEVIVMTGFASLERAIDSMRQGAFDYITKPFKFVEIELIIGKIRERRRLLEENRQLQERVQSLYTRLDLLKDNRSKLDKFIAETTQQLEQHSIKIDQCLELVRKLSLQTEFNSPRSPLHQ